MKLKVQYILLDAVASNVATFLAETRKAATVRFCCPETGSALRNVENRFIFLCEIAQYLFAVSG